MGGVLGGEGFGAVYLGELTLAFRDVGRGRVIGDIDVVFPFHQGEVGDLVDGAQFIVAGLLEVAAGEEVVPVDS